MQKLFIFLFVAVFLFAMFLIEPCHGDLSEQYLEQQRNLIAMLERLSSAETRRQKFFG